MEALTVSVTKLTIGNSHIIAKPKIQLYKNGWIIVKRATPLHLSAAIYYFVFINVWTLFTWSSTRLCPLRRRKFDLP